MKSLLTVIAIILLSFLLINTASAQKSKTTNAKDENVKIAPEFDSFWNEFKVALKAKDLDKISDCSIFPVQSEVEGDDEPGLVNKSYNKTEFKKALLDLLNVKEYNKQLSKKPQFSKKGNDNVVDITFDKGKCHWTFMFKQKNDKYKMFYFSLNCAD